MLPPPDPTRRVAYESPPDSGCWFYRDPIFGGEWTFTTNERTALRWGAAMFRRFK